MRLPFVASLAQPLALSASLLLVCTNEEFIGAIYSSMIADTPGLNVDLPIRAKGEATGEAAFG